MFESLIAFSLRQRLLVMLGTIALFLAGLFALSRLPIDAIPDITNNQVQVLTQAPALSTLEVERFVTLPVELALKSLPDIVELRSLSRAGISVITVVFKDQVDTYFARQLILERLREVMSDLPPGVETPELGPVSTGLGEIFRYTVRDTTGRLSPMELRTIQDWIIRKQLLGVPGLAEVNSIGGFLKQYQVLVDPGRLAAYGLTLREVFEATAQASGSAGAAYIETGPEQLSVRTEGLVTSLDDLSRAVVTASSDGTPVLLGDLAEVRVGPAIRFGAATQDGQGEVVTGFAMQLKGANSRVIVSAVKDRIEEIQRSLPEGVVIEPYYDRTRLVARTITTVAKNLGEGAILVVFVLLLLLAHLRSGLILASVIPLSMLFAVILMVLTGQSGNLMSLGAIDFGLIVDGSLIVVENVLRLMAKRQKNGLGRSSDEDMRSIVYTGAAEVVKAAKFGVFIIIIVYLPILALEGIEGKMFRPMALTVGYALLGSLLLSVTYVPVMCSYFLEGKRPIKESGLVLWLHRYYRPALVRVMARRPIVLGSAVALFALSVVVFTRLGGEFIPRLDEGDIALQIIRLPSVSLSESVEIATGVEQRLMQFEEVVTIVGNTGRAEISTDPMGVEITDAFVILKPTDDWPEVDGRRRTKAELVSAMQEAVEDFPAGIQFYQPIEMRTNELIAGARGDVVVKLFGDDYDALTPLGQQITDIVRGTPGAGDVAMDQTTGSPQLVIRLRRAALARYGMTIEHLNTVVSTAIGGTVAGEVYEGERRFDLVVRFAADVRSSPQAVQNLPVITPTGARVPLSELADVTIAEGPVSVSREDGSRYIGISANVRGRDVASFVRDVQRGIGDQVRLPPGYRVVYGGAFENLQEASRRLMIVVPLALLLILLLLYQTFVSVRVGLIIYLCVPMAVIGGVAALLLAGLPFSISAGVGFIALFGIAVLNGIVMVAAFRKYQDMGLSLYESVLSGADERLRAVVTTATLAALGFLPMMLAHGAGAEVQRPLATVVIGGIISSTLLTLFVLPTVYAWLGREHAQWRHRPTEPDVEAETRGIGRTAMVLLLLSLGSTTAVAQTVYPGAGPLTLEQARERAVAVSPELRHSVAAVAFYSAERRGAGILPSTEFFAGVDNALLVAGRPTGTETALGASQSFRWPSFYSSLRAAADARIGQAEAERVAATRGVLLRVTRAYLEAVAALDLLELADSAVVVARAFSGASERRQELGDANALEPLQAQVSLAHVQRVRAEAVGRAESTLSTLRSILAWGDERPLSLDHLPHSELVGPPEIGTPDPLAVNVDLAVAEAAVLAGEAARRAVRAERLPELNVEMALQSIGGESGYAGGRIGVSIPFSRLLNRGPDLMADAAVAMLEADRDATRRGLEVELRARLADFNAASEQLRLFVTDLVPRAEQAYDIALRLRREGSASYLEVLQAQTMLLETRSATVETRLSAQTIRAEIEALVTPN